MCVGIRPQLPATNTYEDAMARLADLIDRPTCHLEFDRALDDFVCSRCGSKWPDRCQVYDGASGWHGFLYCPNCGARVVRGYE